MANRIQIRRDTSAQWVAVDPILAEGEFGYETDTGDIKIGNGTATWTNLDYGATQSFVEAAVAGMVASAPATLDTLNELAAALGNDENFATTVATDIGTKWTEDAAKIVEWDTAYGWGDHSTAGYLTSLDDFVETTYDLGNKSGSFDVDPDNGTLQTVTATGNITVSPLGWSDGQTVTMFITSASGSQRTLSLTGGLFAGGDNSITNAGVSIATISRIAGSYYISINKGFATV